MSDLIYYQVDYRPKFQVFELRNHHILLLIFNNLYIVLNYMDELIEIKELSFDFKRSSA